MTEDAKSGGFTLVEVVISVVVLLIGVSASLVAVGAALKRSAAAENKMESIHMAREAIERLRSDDIGFGSSHLSDGLHTSGLVGMTYKVDDYPDNDNLKTITVFAPWQDPIRGFMATTEVVTVFSRSRK